MAAPAATVTAHTAIGNREDLADIIYDISPMDTPFLSMARRMSASSVKHEWQTDALDAATSVGAVEGDDASANTFTPTVRVSNQCQIITKVVSVSGTQRAVESAGRADEFSYQLAKRGREIKRNMEKTLTQNQAQTVGSAVSARALASVESWLSTNWVTVTGNTTGTTPGVSSGVVATAPTDGTQATFIEADLKTAIANCWTQGGDPDTIFLGSFNKRQASAFSGIATLNRETAGVQRATILGAADMYISDFGEHAIVADRFTRDRTALVLDMEYWGVSYLRDIQTYPLGKTGDADRSQILVEFTLASLNEAASAKVPDLTTS